MNRRAKKKTDALEGPMPPRESEEDRLIRTGMAMWFARDMKEDTPTREEVEATLMNEGANANPSALPPDIRRSLADLGRQDPRPFVERLKRSCRKLLEKLRSKEMQEEVRLVERIQTTLADLELVLAVRRYGGRPKGSRKKVTPDEINELRKWKAGDRTWVSSSSVADVAKKLNVSRQTVYTILADLASEKRKASDDQK
jgi:hypothetical protein